MTQPILLQAHSVQDSRITGGVEVWEAVRSSTPGAAQCLHFNNAGLSLPAVRIARDHASNTARPSSPRCSLWGRPVTVTGLGHRSLCGRNRCRCIPAVKGDCCGAASVPGRGSCARRVSVTYCACLRACHTLPNALQCHRCCNTAQDTWDRQRDPLSS